MKAIQFFLATIILATVSFQAFAQEGKMDSEVQATMAKLAQLARTAESVYGITAQSKIASSQLRSVMLLSTAEAVAELAAKVLALENTLLNIKNRTAAIEQKINELDLLSEGLDQVVFELEGESKAAFKEELDQQLSKKVIE